MIYLCKLIGTGEDDDSIRPSVTGSWSCVARKNGWMIISSAETYPETEDVILVGDSLDDPDSVWPR